MFYGDSFEGFLAEVEKYRGNSPTWINSTLFFLIDDENILWWIDIRHSINHPNLIKSWWYIGYWISPIHRKKWYATTMLKLWLLEAKKLWIDKVLIVCDIDNIGSNKVIQKNGWVFESEITFEWKKKNRYWINLKD